MNSRRSFFFFFFSPARPVARRTIGVYARFKNDALRKNSPQRRSNGRWTRGDENFQGRINPNDSSSEKPCGRAIKTGVKRNGPNENGDAKKHKINRQHNLYNAGSLTVVRRRT